MTAADRDPGAEPGAGLGAGPGAEAVRRVAAWLFTPADDERKLRSALAAGADAVIADLEDAVAPSHKAPARTRAADFLAAREPGAEPWRLVRVNEPLGAQGQLDLEALRELAPATVMVPKASLASLEPVAAARLSAVALVETARGVAEVEQIASRSEVLAVAIGAVDLAAELDLRDLPDGLELLHVRSRVVLACALAGIPAIDGVHVAIDDREGLRATAERARALGFAGMLCIHPAQIEIVRGAFTATAREIERARAVVEAHERSLAGGRGATLAAGEMVDAASVRRARRVLGDSGAPA